MNHHMGPILGVIARGGTAPNAGPSPLSVIDPTSPVWATEFFLSRPGAPVAIIFVPQLERTPTIGRGAQLDELLPENSPQTAVVPLPTHVTGVLAAVQDCLPLLRDRAEFIAAVRAHAERSYAGVWLKRVAKLDTPSPSLAQHLSSWLPFTRGHLVGIHPRLTVGSRPERPPQPMRAPVLRVSSEPNAKVAGQLAAAYAPSRQELLSSPHRLRARWGTEQALEYVATPDPAGLRLPAPDGRCPTCGDPVWGRCAFCHVTIPTFEHWRSVTVPGVPPVPADEAPPAEPRPGVEAPPAEPAPPQARAFQLPRHRSAGQPRRTQQAAATSDDNPWLHAPRAD